MAELSDTHVNLEDLWGHVVRSLRARLSEAVKRPRPPRKILSRLRSFAASSSLPRARNRPRSKTGHLQATAA